MTKKVNPVNGYRVDLYLGRLAGVVQAESAKQPANGGPMMRRSPREVRSMVETILRSVNTGTCMNEAQAGVLKEGILYKKGADSTVAEEMVRLANSFHLDCEHCLNKGCTNPDSADNASVEVLDISTKITKLLISNGFKTLGQLKKMNWGDVEEMELGESSYLIVVRALWKYEDDLKKIR